MIDFDPAKMLACLNVPTEKLAKRGIDSAAQRVITMREVLGNALPDLETIYRGLVAGFAEGLGIDPQWGPITAYEEELADRFFREEIGTDAYVAMLDSPPADDALVSASLTGRGGTVRADIRLEGPHRDRIREALITGDFFVTPPRVVFDLEAALRGLDVARCRAGDRRLLRSHCGRLSQLEPRRPSSGGRDGAAPAQRHCGCRLRPRCLSLARVRIKTVISAFLRLSITGGKP